MLLALFFVVSGVGNGVNSNIEVSQDVAPYALSQCVFSTDNQDEEVFTSDEGNIFSTLSTTHSMRNPRVNIRRKCGSNGWDFIASDFYLINHQIGSIGHYAYKTNKQYGDCKDYLIRLRKFII